MLGFLTHREVKSFCRVFGQGILLNHNKMKHKEGPGI